MNRSRLFNALFALFLLLSPAFVFAQGVTTSSIFGRVTDTKGEPLIGANVVATHVPSGTVYGIATDLDGSYRIPGMRVGGPYSLNVSYTGYSDSKIDNLNLRLGEGSRQDFKLQEGTISLDAIIVTGQIGTTGSNSGAGTQITSGDIEKVPTLNRDLSDYIRLTPQSRGYSGGNSIAGMNNRYNAIYVDGAVNNDVFGLASSGTNGGQTGISPFSIDIIDQIQVVLSPYDVSLGGFAGGGINAVTKSGTNNIAGTAYYFFQNESLVGKSNKAFTSLNNTTRTEVAPFAKKTYGASLGGALVKDKLFYFFNAELQDDVIPVPFQLSTYKGNSKQADLERLRNSLIENYDYDPGTFGDTEDGLTGLKLFGKIDINLSNNHRLTLRHNYTKAEQFDRNGSGINSINYSNNGIFFPSVTNSSAVELNSLFGSGKSNNLIIGFTSVRDDRDPLGKDFPYVIIEDGTAATINFGSEQFSTGNKLDSDVFSITDNFKIFKKNQTITIGTHNEFYNIYNLFVRQNYGVYRFASVDAFLNNAPAKEYDRTYSLVDDITGDGSAAAAEFKAMQLGFYAQDEIAISPKFTLTAGLRIDIPIILSDPEVHPTFNTTTLPLVRAKYDIANDVEGGKAPDGQLMFSPRVGFTYEFANASKSILRGGVGVFTSRIPFVWPGAMFNNNGIALGGVEERNVPGPITFVPDINNQYKHPSVTVPSGQVDLFTKDFKYPQVLRSNLAFDTKLPGGISATFEGIFTKTLNNIVYYNINSDPTESFRWTGAGGDDRPVFSRKNIDSKYSAIYLASNTNEGYTYNLTASFAKDFDFGLNAALSYSYGDAEALSEGTSSQNSSGWRGQNNTDGRNTPVYGRSDFALGSRILGSLSYQVDWNQKKNVSTTITFLYEGLASNPYSYLIGGNNARNINNEAGSTSANNSLVWIPASASEITLVDKNGIPAAQQWEMLNAFIEDDPYLSKHRGQYAEKNSNWMPFTSYLDLSLRQDFGITAGGKIHKLQFSWDVFNLANLINSEWGVRYFVPGSFNNYTLYDFESYASDGKTPRFSYTRKGTGKDALLISDFSSRWSMRLGVRYIFN